GGMFFGTIFGLILIPGLYVLFAGMSQRSRKKKQKLAPAAALVILVLLAGTGCTNYKAVTVTPKKDVPAVYNGGGGDTANAMDTAGIASLSPKRFFSDPYLLDLIDTALAANPDIMSALQKVEVARTGVAYSRAFLLPSLNAEAGAALRKYSDYTMDGVGNFDTNLSDNIDKDQRIPDPTPDYFLGLRSSWEADLWGKLRSRKAAALARYMASTEGYRMVVTELVSEVATLYYKLLALDRQQRIVRHNIQLQENALEIVKIQKLGGRATELAVQQFEAQLLNTRGLLYTTSQDITEAETELNFLLGSYNRKIARDTSIAIVPLPPVLSAGVPSQLLTNRPDIREAEAQLLAVNADIRAARAAFFPSLNLSAFTGYNAFKTALFFNPGSIVYGVTGGLTAPIFNRRGIKADYERSIAEGRQALYAYQKTILTSFREVTNSLKGMENYSRLFDLKRQEVASLNNAVSVANDLYLVGRASYLEVITAQRNVLDAELEMTNAKTSVFLNAVNLYRSVGGGWR
ncbi:MAG TPA: TolC family protein, partial [Puia sp.]|nr:TolC family protein [Puia sp.]